MVFIPRTPSHFSRDRKLAMSSRRRTAPAPRPIEEAMVAQPGDIPLSPAMAKVLFSPLTEDQMEDALSELTRLAAECK